MASLMGIRRARPLKTTSLSSFFSKVRCPPSHFTFNDKIVTAKTLSTSAIPDEYQRPPIPQPPPHPSDTRVFQDRRNPNQWTPQDQGNPNHWFPQNQAYPQGGNNSNQWDSQTYNLNQNYTQRSEPNNQYIHQNQNQNYSNRGMGYLNQGQNNPSPGYPQHQNQNFQQPRSPNQWNNQNQGFAQPKNPNQYPPHALSFIHSDSRIDNESVRNFRPLNFIRGIIEEDRKDFFVGSPFPRYTVEKNPDIVHIKLMRNNTFITITDSEGNKKAGASAGCLAEMKGGAKVSRYAAEATAEHVGRVANKLGMKSVVMKVKGFTYFKKKRQAVMSWRDGFTHSRGDQNPVVYVEDTTRRAHNGCRLPKRRRV